MIASIPYEILYRADTGDYALSTNAGQLTFESSYAFIADGLCKIMASNRKEGVKCLNLPDHVLTYFKNQQTVRLYEFTTGSLYKSHRLPVDRRP